MLHVFFSIVILTGIPVLSACGQECALPVQRTWISMFDTAGNSRTVWFGFDSLATYGVDSQLCERELPPPPPLGTFEARFVNIPDREGTSAPTGLGQGVKEDYRRFFDYTQVDTFALRFQPDDVSGYPLRFRWKPEDVAILYDSAIIIDGFGGAYFSVSMIHMDSLVVDNSDVSSALIYAFGANGYTTLLPVELMSFTADVQGREVRLSWITASEVNNFGFTIERRGAMEDRFQDLGFVAGAGTTLETSEYSWTDTVESAGTYDYRLRQMDLNGDVTYSAPIAVSVHSLSGAAEEQNFERLRVSVYPNPFNPETHFRFYLNRSQYVEIKVYSMLGQEVAAPVSGHFDAGDHDISWQCGHLSAGAYFYVLQASQPYGRSMGKLLIAR